MTSPRMVKTSTFVLEMDEEFKNKVDRAITQTLGMLPAYPEQELSHKNYMELVNKGHIDTLCSLKFLFREDNS